MKVNSISLNMMPKVSFKGYAPAKDDYGARVYEFNYPFDENKYNCYLEIYNVDKDKDGNYYITDIIPNSDSTDDKHLNERKLTSGKNIVDLSGSYFISNDTPFAYHYKLVPIGGGHPIYTVDAGNIIDNTDTKGAHEIYNYVTQSGSNLAHGGSMKLVIPDNFNVGYVYNKELFSGENILKDEKLQQKAIRSYKHFSNKMGGTLAGIEKSLDDGEFDGYSSIISLPLFTDDTVSSHAYWNKNNMQIAQSLGNINNFASLTRKMFAKGMTFVSDGAFVNEGLEGIHFANVLKWGEKSPFYHWFNASGFPFTLGVFGKNQDFISHKIVNSPYTYRQTSDGVIYMAGNDDYDPKKPTYIQIFDKRLVSEEQLEDNTHLIKSYDVLNTNSPYDINTHNDTVVPYKFEVDPEVYHKNMLNLSDYNKTHKDKIKIDDINGTRFLSKNVYFELEDKIESNIETWDANTDILKLNYTPSHAITEQMKNIPFEDREEFAKLLKQNNIEVQDYAITSGIFWTQKAKDILTLYTAQNLKNIEGKSAGEIFEKINQNIDKNIFPKKIDNLNKTVIQNILDGNYETNRQFYSDSYKDQVKMGLMNLPLDSIEFGDNIASVMATPYIAKRAIHEDEIGVSKYDLYKKGNPQVTDTYKRGYDYTQKMYDKEMSDFALDILDRVQNDLSQKFSEGAETSLYGKYVLPLLTQEIARFAVIKALQPDAKVYADNKTGEIGYDYEALKEISLQTLGIYGASPEDEAMSLISKIRSGISKISEADKKFLADALKKSIEGTSAESFAIADMIVDRSEVGLDWRIDAAKDIGNMDSLRNQNTDFDYTWKNVTNFWKLFSDNILKINPNSYLVAELTDEYDLHKVGNGDASSRYKHALDVRRKFLNDADLTALANYTYYFNDIIGMFGQKLEYEKGNMEIKFEDLPAHIYNKMLYNKYDIGKNYLASSDLNSLIYSYTFVGNHDKPRILHGLALDMGMFFSDLTDKANKDYRMRAYKLVNDRFDPNNPPKEDEVNRFNFSNVSPKAVAMGEAMRTALIESLNELSQSNEIFRENHKSTFEALSHAITDMVNGNYLGKHFEADSFGVKPFDITLDAIIRQSRYNEKYPNKLGEQECRLLKNKAFEKLVKPAFSKLTGMMEYLVALPGKPTLYSGDDLASTGFESKTKNIYLQNRAYIHNEWLDDENKAFVKEYYNKLKNIMALRSRPELDALNNGAPILLPLQQVSNGDYKSQVSVIFRENTDGKMAISLFNTGGINHNPKDEYKPLPVYLDHDKIFLSDPGTSHKMLGLKAGLKEGTKFINANDEKDVYYVHKDGDKYVLEHGDNSPICIKDSAMILYHVPEKSQVAFTGKVSYKPSLSDITKAYASVV